MHQLSIGKGLSFDWAKLTADQQTALKTGFKAGFDSVRRTMKTNMINMNGWGVVRNDGGFETRWMDRAIIADAAWAAPDKNISHGGAFLFTDSDGKPLSGANKYTITFDMNDLPSSGRFRFMTPMAISSPTRSTVTPSTASCWLLATSWPRTANW